MKYVVVSGGVISGIGKGIIASSTGLLLKTLGLKVTAIKIDPYINVDAGTMAPTEHGECFVMDDGGEADLDLGNYERYLNIKLTRESNITTGKIYQHVIERERKGDYLGKTVQVVPHLTDATQDWIERVAKIPVDETNEQPDACIIELGGTVGDIESAPFVEALRQLKSRVGKNNFAHIHVALVPVIHGELKTKPVQHAFKAVTSIGPRPDLIAVRCDVPLDAGTIEKISFFCEVEKGQVIGVHNVDSTYHVPMLVQKQGLLSQLREVLALEQLKISRKLTERGQRTWSAWQALTGPSPKLLDPVEIVLVGKYTNLHDSYLSVIRSLEHAAMALNRRLDLRWVDASLLESACQENSPGEYHKAWREVAEAKGIIVPGGFGLRGTEGMIATARYARIYKKPYLGVCLGMQIAVIEYARNVCDMPKATSKEIDEHSSARPEDHVIVYMPEISKDVMGGNMRLGLRPTYFQTGSDWSRIRRLYGKSPQLQNVQEDGRVPAINTNGTKEPVATVEVPVSSVKETTEGISKLSLASSAVAKLMTTETLTNGSTKVESSVSASASADPRAKPIMERHRHRYEVNPEYIDKLAAHGLNFIGKDEEGRRMEIIELEQHPYFVGVQFHPEYLSRVLEPSKPYVGLVAASIGALDDLLEHGLRNDRAKQLGDEGIDVVV